MPTRIMSVSDLRRQVGHVVRLVQEGDLVIYIMWYGRPAAVLVDYEQYEAMLSQLEDQADLMTLEAAVGEPERDYASFLADMGMELDAIPDNET